MVRLGLEDIGFYCSRRAKFLYLLAKKFEVATIRPVGVTMRLYEPHTTASKNLLLFAQIVCPVACCNHNICILFFDVYRALIFRVHVMYLLDDTSRCTQIIGCQKSTLTFEVDTDQFIYSICEHKFTTYWWLKWLCSPAARKKQ